MNANQALAAVTLAITTAAWAWAGPRHGEAPPYAYYDQARVVSSSPIYEEFNAPRQECWVEPVAVPAAQARSYAGAVLGGIVGGVLGSQVGKGTGKTVAAAAGAATGAIVGDNIDNKGRTGPGQPQVQDVEHCRSVDTWSRRVVGYDVVYRYQGRNYSTVLPYDPGANLRLKVNISVAEPG
jgi:uncharacterized protein YcfJ